MRNKKKNEPPAIVYCFLGSAIVAFIAGFFRWEYFVYAVLSLIFSWLFYKD